jgi:hypothetical protein
MTIDWTHPVETTEDPPRPVRVLATDLKSKYCVAGVVTNSKGDDNVLFSTMDGFVLGGPALRNVPPPKTEPVLMEGWVNLYSGRDIKGTVQCTKREADDIAREGRVECRRIAWMSDGSPVPWEEHGLAGTFALKLNKMTTDRDAWRTQCEKWAAKASEWALKNEALKASLEDVTRQRDDATAAIKEWRTKAEEALSLLRTANDRVEDMRPVVDAAVAGVDSFNKRGLLRLIEAVRAYQQSPKKTAAEAVANVAKMMGPVKNCTTCRFNVGKKTYDGCGFARCITVECKKSDFSRWEPRHD